MSIIVNRYGNAPNMPESTMKATSECKTVGAPELPECWIWNSEGIEKEIKCRRSCHAQTQPSEVISEGCVN